MKRPETKRCAKCGRDMSRRFYKSTEQWAIEIWACRKCGTVCQKSGLIDGPDSCVWLLADGTIQRGDRMSEEIVTFVTTTELTKGMRIRQENQTWTVMDVTEPEDGARVVLLSQGVFPLPDDYLTARMRCRMPLGTSFEVLP